MKSLLERLPPSFPEVALLLEPPAALGLRLASGRGGAQVVAKVEERLEWDGATGPSPETLRGLADRVCTSLGAPARLAVVLGDPLVRAQVLTLTDFPNREEERLQVIRWHIRKVLNDTLEDRRVRYQVLERTGGAVTLWLTLCDEGLARGIEDAFAACGCHVGYLGAATPELFNLAAQRGALPEQGSSLLISRTPRSLSFLFSEEGVPRFFRCKELHAEEEPGGEGGWIAQEIRLTLAYHRERVGGAPLRAVLVRRTSPALALPLEGEVSEGVAVRALSESLGGTPMSRDVGELSLPLFSVLEA